MFFDARRQENGAVISSNICIVGAGPAGVAVATELLKSGYSVSLLESGGIDRRATDLGRPATTTRFEGHAGLWTTRQFGGNANLWHVNPGPGAHFLRLVPLTAADMEQRDWISDSGWPIAHADLQSHYARTQTWFGLDQRSYDGSDWASEAQPELHLNEMGVRTNVYQFADRNQILRTWRDAIEGSDNVHLYTNATAYELETDPDSGRVTRVHAHSAHGRRLSFAADLVVLAQGGLHNPQLLLASTAQHPNGIGNVHDVVGRYYMDHPLLFGGTFTPYARGLINQMGLYDLLQRGGIGSMGHLQLSDETLRREECGNISVMLFPRAHMTPRRDAGFHASQRLRRSIKDRSLFQAGDIVTMLRGIDGVAQQYYERLIAPVSNVGVGGWAKLDDPAGRFTHFEVLHQAEQPPRWDNRVRLAEERDAYGQRRIEVLWDWPEEDVALIHKAQDILARELRRAGLGEFAPERPVEIKTSSTTHFMGTTRMHDDPRKGVVDAHCRVHGVDNLYIAGSSVFTTGGFANPTLTIVALSLRLADRIKDRKSVV
jgi:choline dehydrogenase-like flavoprotein